MRGGLPEHFARFAVGTVDVCIPRTEVDTPLVVQQRGGVDDLSRLDAPLNRAVRTEAVKNRVRRADIAVAVGVDYRRGEDALSGAVAPGDERVVLCRFNGASAVVELARAELRPGAGGIERQRVGKRSVRVDRCRRGGRKVVSAERYEQHNIRGCGCQDESQQEQPAYAAATLFLRGGEVAFHKTAFLSRCSIIGMGQNVDL